MSESGPSSPRATEPKRDHLERVDSGHDLVDHRRPELLERHAVVPTLGIDVVLRRHRPSVREPRARAFGNRGHARSATRRAIASSATAMASSRAAWCWYSSAALAELWPMRAISSLVLAPVAAARVLPVSPQVVEVEVLTTNRRGHRLPLRVPVAAQQRRAPWPGEHDRVGPWLDEPPEVGDQLVDHERGQAHHPCPSIGLRRSERAVGHSRFQRLLDNVHRACSEIDASAGGRGELAPPQRAVGG